MSRLGLMDLAKADQRLDRFTTYKIGGPARWLVEVHSIDDLMALAVEIKSDPIPIFVLGRGSNVVISDSGFDGLVLVLGPEFSGVSFSGSEVLAGGATPLPVLARAAVKAGRGGLEWFVGIPGSVGGAVRMNAGGHGSETGECLIDAQVFSFDTAKIRNETPASLRFAYRSSALTDTDVVITASFQASPVDPVEAAEVMREISLWRRDNQPGGTFNAGSVFTNPPGDSAGRIIDDLGLKGLRVGTARVSRKHANFIEADADGSAQDVADLVRKVQRHVLSETGIELVPEMKFVGEFD
jgi:UDP-N-acetylmuramate dehydrogenase